MKNKGFGCGWFIVWIMLIGLGALAPAVFEFMYQYDMATR